MAFYEVVSIAAFVAALVWALRSRNPLNLGALIGGFFIFGFDWMWCSKSFFNATFTADLFMIPGLHILGERYPFAVACNWAVGFGLIPILLSRVHGALGAKLGVLHFPVMLAGFSILDMAIEVPCVHGLGVWVYHQDPAYLFYGWPWSNISLLGGLLTFSYFGLAYLQRWIAFPQHAGFMLNRETTWKGLILPAFVIWGSAFFLTVIQFFWYSAATPWVDSVRLW